jgi:hypothetical protein
MKNRIFVIGFLIVSLLYTTGCTWKIFGLGNSLSADPCLPGEICVTVDADETTGKELRLILYETTEDEWPNKFKSIPTPSWVVTEYPAVPEKFPIRLK